MIKPSLTSATILALLLFVSRSYEQAATDIQPTNQYSLPEIMNAQTTSDTRQSIFPITGVEIGGFILIMFIAGLANAGGHGGGNLLSPILIIVFNYSESNAIEVVYSLVFGASLGNFLNVFIKRDPKTEKPLIEYSVALVCMPLMLLGALFGVLLNRILATAILIIGILAVTLYSLQKTWEKAKKSYAEETLESKQAYKPLDTENNTQEILFTQVEDISNAELQEGELKAVMEEEHQLFPKLKIGISVILILFIIMIAILRGTSRFSSIIGAPYCGTEYWALLGVAVIGCCIFLLINRRIINRSLKIKELYNIVSTENRFELSKDHIGKLVILSFIAGVSAGLLGIGGGMIMNPALIGIGFPAQSLGATAGFFVVQTSLVSIFQAILYRSVPLADLGFFFAISIVGSFGVSYMLSSLVKRYKRPSIILLSLVVVLLLSLIVTPVFEIVPYIGDFSTLLEFSPLC